MSYNEQKFVIRAYLKDLDGFSYQKAYEYFKQHLGEPKSVDVYDGEVEWFDYGRREVGNFIPFKYLDDDKWGVDFLVGYGNDYEGGMYVDIEFENLQNYVEKIKSTFKLDDVNIRICSYSWYNGVDEPVLSGEKE